MTPHFLDLERVLRIHRSMIETYGGSEGLRDAALLHSAISMPLSSFGGRPLHTDLFEMAAAYLSSPRTIRSWTATSASVRPPRSSSWQ